jgi:hypothetical protein
MAWQNKAQVAQGLSRSKSYYNTSKGNGKNETIIAPKRFISSMLIRSLVNYLFCYTTVQD